MIECSLVTGSGESPYFPAEKVGAARPFQTDAGAGDGRAIIVIMFWLSDHKKHRRPQLCNVLYVSVSANFFFEDI